MQKRGLSQVISVLLFILLGIVVVGIVWGIVTSIVDENTGGVSSGKIKIGLEVTKVVPISGGYSVTVKREVGAGNLTGVKIIMSDGRTSNVSDFSGPIDELATNTYNVPYDGILKRVTVAPFVKTESGDEVLGRVNEEFTFSSEEAIKAVPGLVSWWRFSGDADDENGLNDGALVGNVEYVSGKYGSGLGNFRDNRYFESQGDTYLDADGGELTLVAWVYFSNPINVLLASYGAKIISNEDSSNYGYSLSAFKDTLDGDKPKALFMDDDGEYVIGDFELKKDTWNFITVTRNASVIGLYHQGSLQNTVSTTGSLEDFDNNGLRIGRGGGFGVVTFPGIIDEVMIFNRSLSSQEVASLYALNYDD